MKRIYLTLIVLLSAMLNQDTSAQSGVVINEIGANNQVEFKNTGLSMVDISSYYLCDFPTYTQISNLTLVSGSTMLAPGALVVIGGWNIDENDSELGLYSSPNYSSAAAIVAYVEWGSSGHQRSSVAQSAGIWTANNFVPSFFTGQSIAYSGAGITSASWTAGTPTLGSENSGGCDAEGGTLEGGPFTFCVGDGSADMIMDGAITLTGNSGGNSQWVVTDDQGNILGLPPTYSAVDFDDAGSGTCLVWHLSFEDGLTGAEVGMNAEDLEGCFSLSNSIEVFRNSPVGGTLEGGPFTFCVGDGNADMIMDGAITLSGNSGGNSQWVVTDDQGNILGLPPTYSAVDFDDAVSGTCLVWHLSFEDGLTGAEVGLNAADLQGCFSLSNSIEVIRLASDPGSLNGGTLEGGPFTFCVGDGNADMIMDGAITLSGNTGTNSAWVVTDDQGNILGLPPTYSAVDFDDAGSGTCLVWHLSFEDGLTGAEVGLNAADLQGCFSLSNSIEVFRNSPIGGTLEGGPFTFCVGDGNADMIMDGAITLSGNSGGNSQWVVTDDQGNILGLPPTYSVVDFDDAGSGTCLVWHLSFEDGLTGAEVGLNAADLQGCFSLSNSIEVFRNSPVGGTLEGGPFTFCVGDGDPDQIFDGDISLSGNSGGNSAWVVTDALGEILGLPANYTDVNFDDAPEGICLVWHLSFEDGLIGAEVGLNAADLQGCFSLSDSIVVNRVTDGALCITSVNDKAISNVNLYPNPANGLVRLTADFESIQSTVTIEIYQATGRLIHSATLSNRNSVNEVIDLAHFASGVYMINIISDKAVSNLKLIKE